MGNRRTIHRDANHKIVSQAFRMSGLTVIDTAGLGDGFPDLVISHPQSGRVALVEIKTPGANVSGGDKLKTEVEFMISLVSSCYRIVDDPQTAANIASELREKLK